MGKFTAVILCLLSLTGCAEKVVTKTEFIKLEITDPGMPVLPEKCEQPKYILLEYKGQQMVAEPVQDKLNRIICDSDKVRYSKELINTINYYREAVK